MQDQCSLSPKSVLHCTDCELELKQLEVQSLVKLLQFKCKVSAAVNFLHCTDFALKLHQLKVRSIPWFNHLLYLCASYNHIDNFWKFCLQYSIFSAVFAVFHHFPMVLYGSTLVFAPWAILGRSWSCGGQVLDVLGEILVSSDPSGVTFGRLLRPLGALWSPLGTLLEPL